MKTITTLAAAISVAALAGCAAGGNGNGGAQVAAANGATGGAMAYCLRDKLVVDGSGLTCNWAPTAREACEGQKATTVAPASVASGPDRSTMCADGSPLVRIARK